MTTEAIGDIGGGDVARTRVVVLDRIGLDLYRGVTGEPLLPAERFEIDLVTTEDRLPRDRSALAQLRVVPDWSPATVHAAVTGLWHRAGAPAQHLVAVSERLLVPAGVLRDHLDVSSGDRTASALLLRDKLLMMSHFRARGMRVPQFEAFTLAGARALLDEVGKVVVKPRLGTSSVGVHVFEDVRTLEGTTQAEGFSALSHVVEEFIDGELFHVDSVTHGGAVLAVDVGRTIDSPMSFDRASFIRDVSLDDGPLREQILRFNEELVAAVPWHSGATHLEVFVRQGVVYFLEVAGRSGGGGIWAGFQHRTGHSLLEAVVRGQTGQDQRAVGVGEPHRTTTGYVMLYRPEDRRAAPVQRPWVIATNDLRDSRPVGPTAGWADISAMVSVEGRDELEVASRLDEVTDLWAQGRLAT